MQRRIIAVVTVCSLAGAAALWLWSPNSEGMLSFCWRLGAVMAACWLAYDDVQRLPGWLLALLPVLVIVLVRWPKWLLMAIPLLIAWAALRRLLWPARS